MQAILKFVSNAWALFMSLFVAGAILTMAGQGVFTLRPWLWVAFAVLTVLAGIWAYVTKNPQALLIVAIMVLPMLLAGGMFSKDSLLQLPIEAAAQSKSVGIKSAREAMLGLFFKP